MRPLFVTCLLILNLLTLSAQGEEIEAKLIFGAATTQAPMSANSYGGYSKGCVSGAQALEVDGPYWQVMRLSRNRNWGHPRLVSFIKNFAQIAHVQANWRGLMVGDLSQPRGGPMLTGHRSHQSGLDADIWFYEMPTTRLSAEERENLSAISMLNSDQRSLNENRWTKRHHQLVKTAAQFPEVERIFVFPSIKKALCEHEHQNGDRTWLRKIRPWYGHHYHFHIRLKCDPAYKGCLNQAPPKVGDGCGSELNWWLSEAPWKPTKPSNKPTKPKPKLTLSRLPAQCSAIANAPKGNWDESKAVFGYKPPPEFGNVPTPRKRPINLQ